MFLHIASRSVTCGLEQCVRLPHACKRTRCTRWKHEVMRNTDLCRRCGGRSNRRTTQVESVVLRRALCLASLFFHFFGVHPFGSTGLFSIFSFRSFGLKETSIPFRN